MSTTAFTTCPGRLLPFLHRERRPRHCLNNHPCRHCPPSCPPRSKQPSSENRHKPSTSITVWNQHNKGHAHICYPGPRPDVAVHHLLSSCWHRRPLTCCPPQAAAGASRASSRPARRRELLAPPAARRRYRNHDVSCHLVQASPERPRMSGNR